MSTLEDLLGIDPDSPEIRRTTHLAEADYALISRLVRLRGAQGLSQADVAQRMGVTQSTVCTFERMDNDPRLSTIRRYAHAVEALIRHDVELDTGQLLDDRVTKWTSTLTYRGTGSHSSIELFPDSEKLDHANYESNDRNWNHGTRSTPSHQSDYVPAA